MMKKSNMLWAGVLCAARRGPDFAADFHVWACEFTPQVVKFFLDGRLTHQTDATQFPHGPQSVWLQCRRALWQAERAK